MSAETERLLRPVVAALVDLARRGDRAAFDRLFDPACDRLFALARRIEPDAERAEALAGAWLVDAARARVHRMRRG